MVNIYLDDIRPAPEGFLLARNALEFWKLFHEHMGNINIISFDYDMGSGCYSGEKILEDLISFLKDYVSEMWPNIINIHTDCEDAAIDMVKLILANKPVKVKVMKFKHHRR
jgi:hypothetical protein